MLRAVNVAVGLWIVMVWPLTVHATGAVPPASNKPDQGASQAAGIACASNRAVYWAGGGPKVHVIRRGIMTGENALRPSSEVRPEVVVLVSITGKTATAFGPSFDQMRRAGPPDDLERETGRTIQWEPSITSLPDTIQVVSDDGPEVVARLRFVQCEKGSERQAEKGRAKKPAVKRPAAEEPIDRSPQHPIPQGAI